MTIEAKSEEQSPTRDQRLQVLLSEHQSLMESERMFYTSAVNLLAVAGTFTAAVVGALEFVGHDISVPKFLWTLLPFIPLLVVSYTAFISVMGHIRGPYIHAVERALKDYGGNVEMLTRITRESLDELEKLKESAKRIDDSKSTEKTENIKLWKYAQISLPAQHGVLLSLLSPEYGLWSIGVVFMLPSFFGVLLVLLTIAIALIKVGWSFWQIPVAIYLLCLVIGGYHFFRIMSGKFDLNILIHTPAVTKMVTIDAPPKVSKHRYFC